MPTSCERCDAPTGEEGFCAYCDLMDILAIICDLVIDEYCDIDEDGYCGWHVELTAPCPYEELRSYLIKYEFL